MNTLIVNRKTWSHGKNGKCMLYSTLDFEFDIFGFAAIQLGGASKSDIADRGSPSDCPHAFRKFPAVFEDKHAATVDEIVSTNDAKVMDDARREELLIALFKRMDVALSFKGAYSRYG